MSSETYHEDPASLSDSTKELHRAIVSLVEELDAIDWYQQRADACADPDLRSILIHNRDEEIEHAMMVLEWLRRRHDKFAEEARTYLFTEGSITELENGNQGGNDAVELDSLGIGSLKDAKGGSRWTS